MIYFEDYKVEKDYRVGDIVNWNKWESHLSRIFAFARFNSLFAVENINSRKLKLEYVDGEIDINEISPVAIDGIADKNIFWDPFVAASIVMDGEPIPEHRTNYDYYLSQLNMAFENQCGNNTFSELIREIGITNVHELQHYLSTIFPEGDRLKINE